MSTGIDTGAVSGADWISVGLLLLQFIATAQQGYYKELNLQEIIDSPIGEDTTKHHLNWWRRRWHGLIAVKFVLHIAHVFTIIMLTENQGFATSSLYIAANFSIEIITIRHMTASETEEELTVENLLKHDKEPSWWESDSPKGYVRYFCVGLTWNTFLLFMTILVSFKFPPKHVLLGEFINTKYFEGYIQPTKAALEGLCISAVWSTLSFFPNFQIYELESESNFYKLSRYLARSFIGALAVFMLTCELRAITKDLLSKDTAAVLIVVEQWIANLIQLFILFLKRGD